MKPKKTRVLVVDDSLTVRKHLVEILESSDDFEVVGEAADGAAAIERCRALRPDVITLDMVLPVMSGLAATEHIMAHFPTPILIVSASINRGELFHTYAALEAGAIDVLDKPHDAESEEWTERFLATLRIVSRVKPITHLRARLQPPVRRISTPPSIEVPRGACKLIAIGASTGGPGAVTTVLRSLPAPCPVPILLVLHVGVPFGDALADWLDTQSSHRVSCVRGGESLASLVGRVSMAPPGHHLVVADGKLTLSSAPERHYCRPSVDVLFESIAAHSGRDSAAALLTGMGRDGAAGLLALREAGGATIAQDEATSVVFGMPREAARIGAAQSVLAIEAIGPALGRLVRRPS